MTDTIDVEAPAVELEPLAAPITLFGTTDPRLALERMSELARVLYDVVRAQKLSNRIQGREHLRVEAWTTLGGMLGIVPIVVWTRPNETGDGYIARVEAHRVLDDRIVGAAEAECSRVEKVWKDRYPYMLRSMASTRATSRALRGPLGQIVVLAGYDPTPAEEMTIESADDANVSDHPGRIPPEQRPTREQMARISQLLIELAEHDPHTEWKAEARRIAGVPGDRLTATIADTLIKELEQARGELAA